MEEDYTRCEVNFLPWQYLDLHGSISSSCTSPTCSVQLLDLVAKGGWGQVYMGQIKSGPDTGDMVAIKVVTSGEALTLSKVDELLHRIFLTEATFLAAVRQHESDEKTFSSIIELIGTGVVDKYGFQRHCLVLEWMPCGDAQTFLERRGYMMGLEEAGGIMVHVLRALEAAHRLGWMHRDVKASNILLGSDGTIQLADWGICGRIDESSAKEQASGSTPAPRGPMGTPFWAAPELDAGLPHNESVDIWSFAITFLELINGRPPYYDTSPEGLIRICDPSAGLIPPDLPPSITSWLYRCLSVNPQDRPTSLELQREEFFSSLQSRGLSCTWLGSKIMRMEAKSNTTQVKKREIPEGLTGEALDLYKRCLYGSDDESVDGEGDVADDAVGHFDPDVLKELQTLGMIESGLESAIQLQRKASL